MIIGVELFSSYHLSHGIGVLDSLLAGIALETHSKIVTRNRKHFDFIPGIDYEVPY